MTFPLGEWTLTRQDDAKQRTNELFDWMSYIQPNSPDSVCLDKSALVANEPLTLDHGLLSFDPLMFSLDKVSESIANDLDMFKLLDAISSDDETQAESAATPLNSPAPSSIGSDGEEEPKRALIRKRTKSMASYSSGEDSDVRPKKIKASPKNPRSRLPTSPYRGVSRCTKDGRWQARIRIAKEVVYLGRYPTEEQAARRYDEAARLHHGVAAMLNFVTPEDIQLGRKSVFSEKSAA